MKEAEFIRLLRERAMLSSHAAAMIFLLASMFFNIALVASDVPPAEFTQTCTQTGNDSANRCLLKAEINRLQKIQARVEEPILALPGVLGFGIGRSGEVDLFFTVFVDQSEPEPELPREIEGVPVRVEPEDPVQLLDGFPGCGDTSPCHVDQQPLPVEMGNSGGWIAQTGAGACSLGFKACDLGTGKVVFVTNSHCNQSNTTCQLPAPGSPSDAWIHPGRMDVTQNPGNCIGVGSCSVIGDITGHAAPSCGSNNNYTDATKVESSSEETSMAFRDIGFPQAGPGDPLPGDLVRKSSRTTGDTSGEITHVSVTINVPAPAPGVNGFCCGGLTMKDQIRWQPHDGTTKPGDSGSALLSLDPEFEFQVVGLNWGSTSTYTYANHIDRVLDALNLSLNFVSCLQDCLFSAVVSTSESGFGVNEGIELIELGHRFRGQILGESAVGRELAQVYYQFSDEALSLAIRSPRMLKRTTRLLLRFARNLEELVIDGQTTVTRTDLERVDGLLESYARHASDNMKRAIQTVQRQIVDPQVQKTLGVKVVEDI